MGADVQEVTELKRDDLVDQLFSLEDLAAQLGLPFVAVKAITINPRDLPGLSPAHIVPAGSAVLVVGRAGRGEPEKGPMGCLHTNRNYFTPESANIRAWKRYK